MSETDSQRARIGQALKAGQPLAPMDALRDFGCFRLAARIKELREAGWSIATERHPDGYAVYRMEEA